MRRKPYRVVFLDNYLVVVLGTFYILPFYPTHFPPQPSNLEPPNSITRLLYRLFLAWFSIYILSCLLERVLSGPGASLWHGVISVLSTSSISLRTPDALFVSSQLTGVRPEELLSEVGCEGLYSFRRLLKSQALRTKFKGRDCQAGSTCRPGLCMQGWRSRLSKMGTLR